MVIGMSGVRVENIIERFAIECRKTKTKVITLTNHNSRKQSNEPITARFGFTSDWWRKWREIFQPITNRSNAKPKQLRDYFRHSIENRSIALLAYTLHSLIELQINQLRILKGNNTISFLWKFEPDMLDINALRAMLFY